MVQLYEADFARQWDALLADLTIAPTAPPSKAPQALFVLGSPQSPMRALLTAVAQRTDPGRAGCRPRANGRGGGAAAGAGASRSRPPAAGAARSTPTTRPCATMSAKARAHRSTPRWRPSTACSKAWRNWPSAQPGAAPPAPTGDPLLTLRAAASQAPQPVQRWLLSLAGGGATVRAGGVRQQAAASFNGGGRTGTALRAGGQRTLSVHTVRHGRHPAG